MDPNFFTTPYQLTKSMHRDVYPPVDPKNPSLRVDGKVVLITGAGGGLGYVSHPAPFALLSVGSLSLILYPHRRLQKPGPKQALGDSF